MRGAALLAAKLSPPPAPSGLILRHRLIDRLAAGARGEVTLVCGGPGSGKTSLAMTWATAGRPPGPVAWLSLDPHDNNATRFWSYLLGAVRSTGFVPRGNPLGRLRPGNRVDEAFVRRVADAVSRLPGPMVLVLDDLHEVDNPRIVRSLAFLLRHPMPQLRLIVTTRVADALPLHRPRSRRGLVDIGGAELAFHADEAAQLMRHHGVDLAATELDVLLGRTEGWATGLTLAAKALRERGSAAGLEHFAGSERDVAAYLNSEVLGRLPADTRRFLRDTCVVDTVSGDLADALTGTTQGHRTLERLAGSNALVTTLETPPGWFRYHPLLSDLLRHQLSLEPALHAHDLHRTAAHWFATRNAGMTALGHAVAAQDWPLVGDLVVSRAAPRIVSVDRDALLDLLGRIPGDQLATTSSLALCAALLAFAGQDFEAVAGRVAQARALLAGEDARLHRPVEVLARCFDLVLARRRGDMEMVTEAAADALKLLAEVSPAELSIAADYRAVALNHAGVGLFWTGRYGTADAHLRAAIAVTETAGVKLTQLDALSHLTLLLADQGELTEVDEQARHGLQLARVNGWESTLQIVPLHIALALAALDRYDLDAADAALKAGLAVHRSDREPVEYFALRIVEQRVLLARGHADAARLVAVRTNADVDAGRLPPLLTRWHAAAEADLDLALGRPAEVLHRLGTSTLGVRTYVRLQVCGARAHLALGTLRSAEQMVASLQPLASDVGSAVETWLVTALVEDALREDGRSVDAFARAVTLAEPQNLRRPFLTIDRPRVAAILERYLWVVAHKSEFVTELVADLAAERPVAAPSEVAEELTDRELDVLRYLPTMLRNQDIAERMYVSVNTVKAHLRSLYRKLGVTDRREAVQRARERGLL